MRRLPTGLSLAILLLSLDAATRAGAMVGGAATVAGVGAGRHVVMITGSRGNVCSATAIARDLVLTAGHCVAPAATYRVLTATGSSGLAIRTIAVHPRYNPDDYASGHVTADVALVQLDQPLPANVVPAALAPPGAVAPGDHIVVAGFGTTSYGGDAGIGTPRTAALVATGKPGNLQIRLVDPATDNTRPGLGACTGDSGGPAFVERQGTLAIIGVVSWSTGAAGREGCGGFTGLTPLASHHEWLAGAARKMGSPLP